MIELTNIIKHDFGYITSVVRGFGTGVLHGLYTPLMLTTGLKRANNSLNEKSDLHSDTRDNRIGANAVGDTIGQLVGSFGSQVPLGVYAVSEGYAIPYYSVLAGTNVIDYLVQAYRRAKQKE